MQMQIFFPSDLWWDVLVRLPVVSLIRFKCVCKKWCSIIESSDFVFDHLRLYKNNAEKNRLLVMEKYRPKHSRVTKMLVTIRSRHNFKPLHRIIRHYPSCRFLDSCSGLVLFLDNGYQLNSRLRLMNPSLSFDKNLVFNRSFQFKSMVIILGFVPNCNDIKVVAFKNTWYDFYDFSVCSLKDDVWRTKLVTVNLPLSFMSSRSWWHHLCQGVAHWMVSSDPSCFWEGDVRILCFDFNVEEFCFLELPDTEIMLRFVFVVGESLAVFGISDESSCIWVIKKDCWSVWFTGNSNLDAYNFFKSHRCAKISYDENSNTFFLITSQGYKLKSYNVRDHEIRHLDRVGRRSNSITSGCYSFVDTYVESLIF